MVIRVSNRRTSSSSTKIAPAMGALNAVARPAPAPAASSTRQSGTVRWHAWPSRWARLAPICTVGPSRPGRDPRRWRAGPQRTHREQTPRRWRHAPLTTASTWGMPLPSAWGATRRTSQAATAVAAAHPAITSTHPTSASPCAQARITPRTRSAWSSASRKRPPPDPRPRPRGTRRVLTPAGCLVLLPIRWSVQVPGS